MKVTLLYTASCGYDRQTAEAVHNGIRNFFNSTPYYLEIKLIDIDRYMGTENDFIAESQAILLGTPLVDAYICKQISKFLGYESQLNLQGKLGAFAATDELPSSAEAAVGKLLLTMTTRGMLVCAGGAFSDEAASSANIYEKMSKFGEGVAKTMVELYHDDL